MRFTPYVYYPISITATDGDTLRAVIDLGFFLTFEVSIRLIGVNAPELRGAEKAAGMIVKRYVNDWIDKRRLKLMVRSVSLDKYANRIVGDIVSGTESLCEALKAKGYVTVVSPDGAVTRFTTDQLDAIEKAG
jgi:micrococcal nuclease